MSGWPLSKRNRIPKSSRRRRKTILILAASAFGVFACLILFCGLGMNKNKFGSPSTSSRSAKWGGVFLHPVELIAIAPDAQIAPDAPEGFKPREAWIESIYEHYESFSFLRKRIAGKRLCIRIDYSPTGPFRKETSLSDLHMTINGKAPKPMGGVWNSTGTTFDFPIKPDEPIPEEGEVTFMEKSLKIESRFRYRIR